MRNMWTIAAREFRHYFVSPIAYAVAAAIFLILGLLFYANLGSSLLNQTPPDPNSSLSPLATLLLFGMPAITMRLISDEQRSGTIELLLTAPVRDWEMVVGKWLGAMGFGVIILAVTWFYPIILNTITSPGIDQGPLVSAYLGMLLMLSAMVAIGVMASALFANAIAAYFTSLGILLVLWIMGLAAQVSSGGLTTLFNYLDFSAHFFNTGYAGVIDTRDLAYYLSLTALALFLGTRFVEARRWK